MPALAQRPSPSTSNDEPIPYPSQEQSRHTRRREMPREPSFSSLSGRDDPNLGLSVELVGGLMLLESARGAGVEPRPAYGARFTWEWGRLLSEEGLREALFGDLTWSYAAQRAGTHELFADAHYHYFTAAPAYGFPLGSRSPFSIYLQVGAGLIYQFSSLNLNGMEYQTVGVKPLIQYGVGVRGRPAVVASESVRVSFRFELTRFRRGYMDDTFVGASLGATF